MTTRVITVWPIHITALTRSMSAVRFLTEILFIFKAIKFHLTLLHSERPKLYGILAALSAIGLKGLYDKQN